RMRQSHETPFTQPPWKPVKPTTQTIASLLWIILLPFHIGGDIALGFDKGGPGMVYVVVPILLIAACGTLLLAERRSGQIIMFLGGLAALGMPIIHRTGGFTPTVAKSPGGLFFIWTLVALGVSGGLAMILSARGLWKLRSRKG
ncbi:MAG TPA: hypothetical protein VHM24_10400, partial [Gemmatimonadaceae bacterium]|nr:hypothetical protein [Gemmatimonadaceae bacterium]